MYLDQHQKWHLSKGQQNHNNNDSNDLVFLFLAVSLFVPSPGFWAVRNGDFFSDAAADGDEDNHNQDDNNKIRRWQRQPQQRKTTTKPLQQRQSSHPI